MAKARIPNQKKAYNALNSRLLNYVVQVQSIYDMVSKKMAEVAVSTDHDGIAPFSFSDYPEYGEAIKDIQAQFVSDMGNLIMRGTSEEWMQSNLIQDLLADKVLKLYRAQVRGNRFKHYYQTNSEALKAFQQRRDKGLNLSDKLWRQSALCTGEIETAISTAIEKGMSAITLSKRVSRYLSDYPSLKHDYWEKYAKAADCHDCEYRSIRLARSEINMAYRTAEQERWQQFDFITGYEIKLSGSHPAHDICDLLAGKYPKDFKWTGWHPNDMCYCIPIIMSEEEYWGMREGSPVESQQVIDMPEAFKDYVRDNQSRIEQAHSRGTDPYWVRDNAALVSRALNPNYLMDDATVAEVEQIAGFNRIPYARFTANDYNQSAMKGFDLMRFDKSFESLCDSYEIKLASKHCYISKNMTELQYYGTTPSGGQVILEREFVRGKNGIEVNHAIFKLPDDLQGKGMSKEVFRYLFREYGDMGVSRINVTANMSVGGYCWARYGFCTDKAQAMSVVSESLARGNIIQSEYEEAISVIKMYGKNSFPMNLLAELPYAKKMLKGLEWNGYLDMSDTAQVRFMKDYVGYSRKI